MTATFLERNKKKSLLAALLLFLRKRKVLVLLLLLLLLTSSTVFLGPSLFRMGFGAAQWGFGPARKNSYNGLFAAFRSARTRVPLPPASVGVSGSLDFVKGGKAALEHEERAGADGARLGTQSVAGIIDPSDPKTRGSAGVAI